ncbi:FG-GAP-like repeat-containing protein [Arthrobacter sp. Hor0625]|uniref:FG-GAP-like repeat-containing protein n=1 Tax=Arthrobacter sp. Hor0625 TaxID=3457358 RepID=UPI00403E8609
MRSAKRSLASITGLLLLAAGLVTMPSGPAVAVDTGGSDSPPSVLVEGTPHSEHVFEPGTDPAEKASAGGLQTEAMPTGPIQVTLVTAALADNKTVVDPTAAENTVKAASQYWSSMSNGRITMNVSKRILGHKSAARSTQFYGDLIDKITSELGWRYATNTALLIFIPAATLTDGALGAGYSGFVSSGVSGRILMPKIGSYTTSVISHEFGHVLGSMHADSLQCKSGASDVGTTSTGLFSDSSCYIREYGDTADLMGLSRSDASPVISSSLWDYLRLGSGNGSDIRNVGVASGAKRYTLKPWGGKDPNRALKFTDPISKEVYYLELRQPVGYDSYLSTASNASNRGVKIVQRGGSTPASSLVLKPYSKPDGNVYTNLAWQQGSTFITHAGTRVRIDSVTATAATVTITADPARFTKLQFSVGDFSGDGRPDLISREPNGTLQLSPGESGNRVGSPIQIGSGWDAFNSVIGSGDFNGDNLADILARASDGALMLYPGNGKSGFLPKRQVGSGWNIFIRVVAAGDFDGDGNHDLFGVLPTGELLLYPGNGSGGFLPRRQVGSGWQGFTGITAATDMLAGRPGLVARSANGTLYLYPGNGSGGFRPSVVLATGTAAATDLVGGQDFTADGRTDLLLAGAAGPMALNAGDGTGKFAGRLAIGSGWNRFSDIWEAGDFDGDARADILARDAAGALMLYPGNGSGSFKRARQVGSGWQIFDQVISAANFDGKSGPDLVARSTDGNLWLYPTNGVAEFSPRKRIGHGWGTFARILSPGDFSGDGRSDIVAQGYDGKLWLYPGDGGGGFLPRRQIGSGWASFSQVMAANGFAGDGKVGIMARAKDGELWLYPGNGSGGFLPRRLIGSGWNAFRTVASVGNFGGMAKPNVIAADPSGGLWLYTGNGTGGFQTVVLNPR